MKVREIITAKPTVRISIGGVLAGAALTTAGLIAIFGRFHGAQVLFNKLGFKAAIGLAGAGGTAFLTSTVILIANRVLRKKSAPPLDNGKTKTSKESGKESGNGAILPQPLSADQKAIFNEALEAFHQAHDSVKEAQTKMAKKESADITFILEMATANSNRAQDTYFKSDESTTSLCTAGHIVLKTAIDTTLQLTNLALDETMVLQQATPSIEGENTALRNILNNLLAAQTFEPALVASLNAASTLAKLEAAVRTAPTFATAIQENALTKAEHAREAAIKAVQAAIKAVQAALNSKGDDRGQLVSAAINLTKHAALAAVDFAQAAYSPDRQSESVRALIENEINDGLSEKARAQLATIFPITIQATDHETDARELRLAFDTDGKLSLLQNE